jgi:hypothetical protein
MPLGMAYVSSFSKTVAAALPWKSVRGGRLQELAGLRELWVFFLALDHVQDHLPSKNAVQTQLFIWGEQLLPTHYCKLH